MTNSTAAPGQKNYQASAWHFAALVGGNAALALGPWFVRLADTGPVSAGFWRLLLPLPILAVLAWRERPAAAIDRKVLTLVIFAGIFFAVDLGSWHIGIEQTRLANATLFGNSGSVVLMVWGLFALRRLPSSRESVALLAAIAGGAILLGRSLDISTTSLVGDLFCLAAGIFYVLYLLPAQAARARLGQWTVLAFAGLAGVPVLLAFSLALGEPLWPGAAGWGPLIALAVSSQLIGQGLLVFALKHFSALIIGMALLTQPALAALVGWLAFDEVLEAADLLGMALVAGALVLAKLAEPRAVRAVVPEA